MGPVFSIVSSRWSCLLSAFICVRWVEVLSQSLDLRTVDFTQSSDGKLVITPRPWRSRETQILSGFKKFFKFFFLLLV